jgi:AraC-like DNA-binding protein
MHDRPLSSFNKIDTDNVDTIRESIVRSYCGTEIDIDRKDGIHGIHNCIELGCVAIHYGELNTGFSLCGGPFWQMPILHLPLAGQLVVQSRGTRLVCSPGTRGALLGFPHPVSISQHLGYRALRLHIRRHALEDALARMLGVPPRGPLRFLPAVDLCAAGPRHLLAMLLRLADLFDHDPAMLLQPFLTERYADLLLAAALTCLPHNHLPLLDADPPPGVPKVVRLAEEYLEANADKPVRMGDLARVVGMGTRSIQLAFQRHRGYSPSHFLRECRLGRARRMLVQAAPGTTVLAVALACGFGSQSHFTLCYRRRFGETPSETLRAGAGAPPAFFVPASLF